MNNETLKEWYTYYTQYKNGYHLSKSDLQEFIRLNHLLMELSHEIHNKNMLNDLR